MLDHIGSPEYPLSAPEYFELNERCSLIVLGAVVFGAVVLGAVALGALPVTLVLPIASSKCNRYADG